MCIAIFNDKEGKILTREQLNNSWENNPDGAGLLWVDKKVLKVFKTFDKEKWIKKYFSIKEKCPNSNIVLHSRISTSGLLNKENTHPFIVKNKRLGFVHNGVIGTLGNSKLSDTWHFNEMLKDIYKNFNSFYKNGVLKELLGEYIGYSKLIFLDNENNFEIVNDNLGDWIGLNWFSNNSHSYNYSDYSYNKKKKNTCLDCSENINDNWDETYDEYGNIGYKWNDKKNTVTNIPSDTEEVYIDYLESELDKKYTKKDIENGILCPNCDEDLLEIKNGRELDYKNDELDYGVCPICALTLKLKEQNILDNLDN